MPHISLSLYPGRSREEVEALCRSLQQCLMERAGWKPGDISVSVEAIEANRFTGRVEQKIQSEKIIISSDYIKLEDDESVKEENRNG